MTVWIATLARGRAERSALAQPAQRVRLAAALAPARQQLLQLPAVAYGGEHLDLSAAAVGGSEPHEVELTRVADPGGTVKRPFRALAPPQPDVALARTDATIVGGVEAGQRAIALALALVDTSGCNCSSHRATRFREEGSRRSLLHPSKRGVTRR